MQQMDVIQSKLNIIITMLDELSNVKATGIEWLTGTEVCKVLGISTRTLQNYRDGGKIGFSKIGRKAYYKAKDVEDLIEENFYPRFNFPKTR